MNIEIESLWYQTKLFYFGTLNVDLSLSWLATSFIYNQIDCVITSFSTLNVHLSMSLKWNSEEHQLKFRHLWKCCKLQYWVSKEYSPFPCLSCKSFCCMAWGILTNFWLWSHGSWQDTLQFPWRVLGFFFKFFK